MSFLLYFLLGIIFIDCVLPLLEGVTGCICTRMEQYKAKLAVKINEYNMEIEKMAEPPMASGQPIGFHCEAIEEEYDD